MKIESLYEKLVMSREIVQFRWKNGKKITGRLIDYYNNELVIEPEKGLAPADKHPAQNLEEIVGVTQLCTDITNFLFVFGDYNEKPRRTPYKKKVERIPFKRSKPLFMHRVREDGDFHGYSF